MALYINSLYVKLQQNARYQTECFYIILSLKEDFTREVIAIVNMPSESAQDWQQIFMDIKAPGIKFVDLFVSDGLSGINKAISQVYNKTPHQKCVVHLQRTLQSYIRR